jgi:hypothetical protein
MSTPRNRLIAAANDRSTRYIFDCPACNSRHWFTVRNDRSDPSWTFDGDLVRPTVDQAIHTRNQYICILRIARGRITYLDGSTHEMRGQTIEMPTPEPMR